MRGLYRLGTKIMSLAIRTYAPFNHKAHLWVQGREDTQKNLLTLDVHQPTIWFHCASLGEYEQGRPVIQKLKEVDPRKKVVVTFFSPSGYEVRKNDDLLDYCLYLPEETPQNVEKFLDCFQPQLAVFVKYEFWYDYLKGLYDRNISTIFISASFRPSQVFFKSYGGWFVNHLRMVEMFFVQNKESKALLNSIGISQVLVSGDTRFDRVLETKAQHEEIIKIKEFKGDNKLLVFGSAWGMETQCLLHILKELPADWKVLYAPHEIDEAKLDKIARSVAMECTYFSKFETPGAQMMFLDTIGHLARAYKYAHLAVVGGGFIDGIHNILEPLAFGVPVFFGPNHTKFWEAKAAINAGVGFEFGDYQELKAAIVPLIQSPERQKNISEKASQFVIDNAGATTLICDFIEGK